MSSLRLMWIEPAVVRLMKNSCLAKACVAVVLLLLVAATAPRASAQEKTWGDSSTPLVYNVENTAANYTAPNFPDFAHLPIIRPLPDAFRFANGSRDTSFSSWERRRSEILAAVEKYELGPKPDCHDCTITASYTPPASGSSTGSLTVNVTRNGKTLTLTSGVYIPQGMGSGPFPALIPMELGSFSFNGQTFSFPPPPQPDYGSLPASVFSGLPIATVGYVHTQVAGYAFTSPSDHTQDPFYLLYPELCAGVCTSNGTTITSNSGEYAAWAWGVSRLIDGITIATHQSVNPMPIDVSHLAVTGCSYAGKMAMIAGALDERIALSIGQENGGGGAPSWRVSHEIEAQGTVEDVDDTNYDWWAGQMYQFAGDNVYKLPTDHEELMALVAPRALLQTGNTDFYWLTNRSNLVASRATQQVYNAFGIGDRFGFYIDGGHDHCATLPAEAPAIASFVNKFMLGQSATSSDVEVLPTAYATLDTSRWTAWWGTDPLVSPPKFPNDWTMGGNLVMSLNGVPGLLGFIGLPGSVPINTGSTVNTGYQFAVRGSHPTSTVSLSGGYVEADVSCLDGTSYTMTIPVPDGNTSIPTNSSWSPSPQTWQGSAASPGCSVSVEPGIMTDAYFAALGHNNGIGNPPLNPGVTSTDTTDPLSVRFACSANGRTSQESQPLVVSFQ
jgi:hypothetical protein